VHVHAYDVLVLHDLIYSYQLPPRPSAPFLRTIPLCSLSLSLSDDDDAVILDRCYCGRLINHVTPPPQNPNPRRSLAMMILFLLTEALVI
jgi:hypothetical protein